MPAYTINLNTELIEKLSQEENKSATVQRALNIYYETSEDPKEKLKLILNEIKRLQTEREIIEKQIENLEETRKKHKTIIQEIEAEELAEKKARAKARADEIEKEAFNNYRIPKEKYDALWKAFKSSGERLPIFMRKNQIERKEVKNGIHEN